jgi:hypothetical protein
MLDSDFIGEVFTIARREEKWRTVFLPVWQEEICILLARAFLFPSAFVSHCNYSMICLVSASHNHSSDEWCVMSRF